MAQPTKDVSSLPYWKNSELVSYEEFDEGDSLNLHSRFQRSIHAMHHQIPYKPFRAVIRFSPLTSSTAMVVKSAEEVACHQVARQWDSVDSPASFPPTPFSRSVIINRSTEKVDSLMFAARDRLRLVEFIDDA